MNQSLRDRSAQVVQSAQAQICQALEKLDGKAKFLEDLWERTPQSGTLGIGFGGGKTAVIQNGNVFEKGGVNFSKVEGTLPRSMSKVMVGRDEDLPFFATGISLVIHPHSPLVPTTHANYRYLEVGDKCWFGGGADLTPYVLYDEDARHFHRVHKEVCDRHDLTFYPAFKRHCDEYFYLPHRKETRGIGGIFFDYMGRENPEIVEKMYSLVCDLAPAFIDAYGPIVEKRSKEAWTEKQKEFQLLRRGRYVEFNLIYDRGTQFGLQTSGRTESILMSLPAEVRWGYNVEYPESGPEGNLIKVLQQPQEWV